MIPHNADSESARKFHVKPLRPGPTIPFHQQTSRSPGHIARARKTIPRTESAQIPAQFSTPAGREKEAICVGTRSEKPSPVATTATTPQNKRPFDASAKNESVDAPRTSTKEWAIARTALTQQSSAEISPAHLIPSFPPMHQSGAARPATNAA